MNALPREPDVVIVGAGPAGLSAATILRQKGVKDVVVLEREHVAGGVPRHCDHQGFGLQDLRRPLTGPAYARRLVRNAQQSGVALFTQASVQAIESDGAITLTSPAGRAQIRPRATLLATGVRERPRPARHVPGDRPFGVFTTGQLQQWVSLHHFPVGTRALIVGAEHVSFSAVLTLRHAGVTVCAMITGHPQHQSIRGAALLARRVLGVPLLTSTRVRAIEGHGRVERVILEHGSGTESSVLDVDTVVFTGDWVPDSEIARRAGVSIDPRTLGPIASWSGATTTPGLYVAGNLVQPAETAGVAAVRGRAVGEAIASFVTTSASNDQVATVSLVSGSSVEWVVPQIICQSSPPKAVYFRSAQFSDATTAVVRQGGRELGRSSLRHAIPNRGLKISGDFARALDPSGGPVVLDLE